MQSAPTTSNPRTKEAGQSSNYAPSVPISVYRQLAAELQATRTQLDTLNQQNYQLTQQNQQLRHELEQMVQNALRLQQVLYPDRAVVLPGQRQAEQVADQIRRGQFGQQPGGQSGDRPTPKATDHDSDDSIPMEHLFTEQPIDPRAGKPSPKARDLSNVWLAILIVVIVVTAFGAGFLAMPHLFRQFAPNGNNR
jgi:hypothetical protein